LGRVHQNRVCEAEVELSGQQRAKKSCSPDERLAGTGQLWEDCAPGWRGGIGAAGLVSVVESRVRKCCC
jgi:hypothetical protein